MICKQCGIDKPCSAFYTDKTVKSGYMSKCKECVKRAVHDRYQKKRDEIISYSKEYYSEHKEQKRISDKQYHERVQSLKRPCEKCGDERLYVIDFHHIDPNEKSFNINRKSCKSDFALLESEVKKCVCLCRNCHKEFHYFYGLIPKEPVSALEEYLGRKVGL